MNRRLAIVLQLMRRDWYIFSRALGVHLINYCLISPFLMAVCFGYLLPMVGFDTVHPILATEMVVSNMLWSLFPLTSALTMKLVYDLEGARVVCYQGTLISPILVLLERVCFFSLVSWLSILPYVGIAWLVMGDLLVLNNFCMGQFLLVTYLGSLLCVTLTLFIQLSMRNSDRLGDMWLRAYFPILALGGGLLSWMTYYKAAWWLGILVACNPCMYFTEGLRQAIIGGEQFFSIAVSSGVMLISASIFFILSCVVFKRKTDCIF